MKKFVIIFYLFLISLCVSAQNESSISHTKTVNDSTLIKIHAIVEDIDFRMHGLDRYKLYPTEKHFSSHLHIFFNISVPSQSANYQKNYQKQ